MMEVELCSVCMLLCADFYAVDCTPGRSVAAEMLNMYIRTKNKQLISNTCCVVHSCWKKYTQSEFVVLCMHVLYVSSFI